MGSQLAIPTEVLARISHRARCDFERWHRLVSSLATVTDGIGRAIRITADASNVSHVTLKRKLNAFKKQGAVALLDKRLCGPAYWNSCRKGLPPELIELWRELCESNKRKCKPAHRQLVKMWANKDLRLAKIFPGFPGWPHLPDGMSYENLLHYRPTNFELTVARIGTSAARAMLPKVHFTRVGVEVGQVYMFDDQDYDVQVAVVGVNSKWIRPSGFNCLDYSSACEIAQGYKPTILNPDGTKQKLRQVDFQWFVVNILTTIGYRADIGTLCIAEHGTANGGKAFYDRVTHATNGMVTFDASGIHGKQLPGLFGGKAHGNPGFKAARESLFNLIRNEQATLPAPTGMDRHHAPEENYGVEKYVRDMLYVIAAKPELADILKLPVLRWSDFVLATEEIVQTINSREDHDIEGWEALGRTTGIWRLALEQPWLPESQYLALPADKRSVVDAMIQLEPNLWQFRLLSPLEVWKAERSKLTRVEGAAIPLLLGPEAARSAVVTQAHEIILQDQEIAPEKMWFDSALTNGRILPQGAKLAVYLNPYDPSQLQVCDLAGVWLGSAKRVYRICKTDADAAARRYGEVKHIAARLTAPVIARGAAITRQRTKMLEDNANHAAGIPVTADQKEAAREIEDLAERAEAALAKRNAEFSTQPTTHHDATDDDSY